MTSCNICIDLINGTAISFSLEATAYDTLKLLLKTIDSGCCVCHRLFCQLPEEEQAKFRSFVGHLSPPSPRPEHWPKDVTQWPITLNSPLLSYIPESLLLDVSRLQELVLEAGHNLGESASFFFSSSSFPGPELLFLAAAQDKAPPLRSNSTNSEETFSKIRGWLDTCEKSHKRCRGTRRKLDAGWYPKRLVKSNRRAVHTALMPGSRVVSWNVRIPPSYRNPSTSP